MGLVIDRYETKHGIKLEHAYAKITSGAIIGEHSPKRFYIHFDVDVFASIEAREAGKPRLESRSYSMRINTDGDANQYNIIKQCYLFLKEHEPAYEESRDA